MKARTRKPDPTSRRTVPLPSGWETRIRPPVLARDGNRCTWVEGKDQGGSWRDWAHVDRCPNRANQVDHMGDPDDHRIEMLRALCEYHHNKHSSAQANAARRVRQAQRKRPTPKHPGLIG